ncbi:MAG: hypothetical protein ABIH92_05210 [Nanoarchaeota archaeon]
MLKMVMSLPVRFELTKDQLSGEEKIKKLGLSQTGRATTKDAKLILKR